ncbi:hypothetical protein NHQ30_006077 [Ciborinia camelliae]|nr:hypothetical protein NHQ30_006077 [Ciborinia camelliae]
MKPNLLVKEDETWAHTVLRLLSVSDTAKINPSHLMQCLPQELEDLHTHNSRCAQAHQVVSVSESSSTLIIDRESSVFDLKNDLNVEVPCDHLDLWQFKNDHAGAKAVCRIVRLIASSMTHKFDDKFYEFLSILSLLSPAPYQPRIDAFVPMLVHWTRSNSVFNHWKTTSSNGVLCLHGPPGSGTAFLTSQILKSLLDSENLNPPLIIGFAFNKQYTNSRSILSLFTSLTHQILLARPSLFHQVSKLGEEMMTLKIFTPESFWTVLNHLLRASFGTHIVCIIDSVHECDESFHKSLEDLKQLTRLSEGTLKVILTYEDPYTGHVGDEALDDILLDSEIQDTIVKSVVQLKLNDLTQKKSSWKSMEQEIAKELCNTSTSYLAANLNIDFLRRANIRSTKVATKEILRNLPSTLNIHYDLIIHNIMALKEKWIFSALKWVTFAARPLTEIELAVAVAFDEMKQDQSMLETPLEDRIVLDIIQNLNRYIGPFFKVVNNSIQFVHSEFRNFLAQHFNHSFVGSSGAAEMLSSCIDYIQLYVRQVSIGESNSPLSNLELSLLSYAITSWPEHYTQSKSYHHVVEYLSNFLGQLDASDIKNLSDVYCQTQPVDYHMEPLTSALHLACRFGLSHYVERIIQNENSQYTAESLFAGLDTAARFGQEDVANLLIQHGVVSESALGLSIQSGDIYLVKKLLSIKHDINQADSEANTPLHHAAARGDLEILLLLLENGADKNLKRTDGSTALHLAAIHGHLAIVKVLIEDKAGVTNDGHDSLQLASPCGHGDVVQYLLEQMVDVNRTSNDGKTALHLAVEFQHPFTTRMLLKGHSKVYAEDENGFTPLHLAAREGDVEIMQQLLDADTDTPDAIVSEVSCTEPEAYIIDENDTMSPLQLAAHAGHIKIIEALLRHKTIYPLEDISAALYYAATGGHTRVVKCLLKFETKKVTKDGSTALCMAIKGGHLEVIKLLFQQDNFHFDKRRANYTKLLHYAAMSGHLPVAQFFISVWGITATERRNELGWSAFSLAIQHEHFAVAKELMQSYSSKPDDVYPLHIAATQGNKEMIEILLNYPQKWKVNDKNQKKQTPLHIAAKKSFLAVVTLLLQRGAKVDFRDKKGNIPLSWAAKRGAVEITTVLIQNGSDINARNNANETPIYIAAYTGSVEVVRAFLSRSPMPDIAVQSESGWTALHAAFDNADITRLLLEKGATEILPKSNFDTPLHVAAYFAKYDTFCLLLETEWSKSLSTESLSSVFRLAATEGGLDIMKLLLTNNVDINNTDEDGTSALHEAVQNQAIDIVKFLLQEGADVHKVSKVYQTPLLTAAQYCDKHSEIANLLIKNGSDVNMVGGEYHTALQAAASHGNCDMIEILLQMNAKVNEVGGQHGTALAAAVYSRNETAVIKLLNAGADPNISDEKATALQIAASNAMTSTVKLLIEKGANINVVKQQFGSALHAAIRSRSLECAETLLRNDANTNLRVPNYLSPLQCAAQESQQDIFQLLVENNADITAKDQDGHSILMYALYSHEKGIINNLLENELIIQSINHKDCSGNTALSIAVKISSEFVEDLLKKGADPDSQDSEGKTPLIHAVSLGSMSSKVISLLLSHNANPILTDYRQRSPLYWVCLYENIIDYETIIEAIRHSQGADDYFTQCESAISAAVSAGNSKLVSKLLSIRGLSPNVASADGWTPLYTAKIYGFTKIESQLVNSGAVEQKGMGWPLKKPSKFDNHDRFPCLQVEDEGKVVTVTETAFYTKNGKFLGHAFSKIRGKLYPAVSFRTTDVGSSVAVKFWDEKAEFCYKGSLVDPENLETPDI